MAARTFLCHSDRNQHGMQRRDFLRVTLGTMTLVAISPWGHIPAVIKGSAQAIQSSVPPCGPLDGTPIDRMENASDWHIGTGGGATADPLVTVPGCKGQALQLTYHLGPPEPRGAYVQIRRDWSAPDYLDLSSGDHIRFFYKGTTRNTLEIGLTAPDGQNYFASSWNAVTHVPWCTYATWDFQDFRNSDGQPFPNNFRQVAAIFISVANKDGDNSGDGSLIVDELQYLNIASRPISRTLECPSADPMVIQRAAAWVAAQQQAGGLLKSWQEEPQDFAWLYDSGGVGLIVLSETDLPKATKLVRKLHDLQNPDGSWYAGYHYLNDAPINTSKPVGAIAWTVYGLMRYSVKSGDLMARQDALKGAGWLAQQQRPDGSLPGEFGDPGAPTEANLDSWWALHATGYQTQADLLQNFLLNKVWDNQIGRFKSTANAYSGHPHQIFLDNQTWGAAFLRAIGREEDSLRALSYARWTLATSSSDGRICGLDGGGPFSVWYEGTLQYVTVHGENSQYYWNQIVPQQAADGGLPGSPDDFQGYMVWLTRWHGIAPAAWLYLAGTGGPFRTQLPELFLGLNEMDFHRGDINVLTADVIPGITSRTVDVYVAIRLPNGQLLFYPSFTSTPTPVVRNWTVAPFCGELFRYTFNGGESAGTYTWLAAFTQPGTLNIIGEIAQTPFTFSP